MRLLDEAILELVIRFYPGYPGSGGKIMSSEITWPNHMSANNQN